MHKTAGEATEYVHRLFELIQPQHIDLVLAPPFTALHAATQAMKESSGLALAGQNIFWEDAGAFTGEVSAPMLKEAGCRYVIVGHSERRHWFGERDEEINKKIRAALRHGLRPILCVGESLADRERGDTKGIVTAQLEKDLTGFTEAEIADVALAYEPIWADWDRPGSQCSASGRSPYHSTPGGRLSLGGQSRTTHAHSLWRQRQRNQCSRVFAIA